MLSTTPRRSQTASAPLRQPTPLSRVSLIREVYRALLNSGRTYAAFTPNDKAIVKRLASAGEILDPMSGYGMLTRYCGELGLASFNVEFNPPQYLWQILCHPGRSAAFLDSCNQLRDSCRRWPAVKVRALASDDWYPDASLDLLSSLFEHCRSITATAFETPLAATAALALLTPFAGRLSCSAPGGISAHTKSGGLCVYSGWKTDLRLYIACIEALLRHIASNAKCLEHTILFGDARTSSLPQRRFHALLTSPPYPNHRDFSSLFAPENAFLEWIAQKTRLDIPHTLGTIIGSNFVAGSAARQPTTTAAREFCEALPSLALGKQALYDETTYYQPYFSNYFADLETAYANVATSLAPRFEGYIVVVNNTHRGVVVPLAESIIDIWTALGCSAEIASATESFHVGTKNPRARGIRARHTEYIIRLWR